MREKELNLCIRDLLDDVGELRKTSILLDQNALSKSSTWRGLHEKLFNKGLISKEIQEFEQAHYGGGSPGEALLECLKIEQKHIKIETFIEKAKELKRMDIFSKLEEIRGKSSITLMSELNSKDTKQISNLLDLNIRGIKGWEFFAEAFGYDDDQRKSFKSAVVSPNQWSPTDCLLRHLGEKSPSFPLRNLIGFLKEIYRNDVVSMIESFMAKRKASLSESESNCTNEPPPYPPGNQLVRPIQDIGFEEQKDIGGEEIKKQEESGMVQEEEEANVEKGNVAIVFSRSPVVKAGDTLREHDLTEAFYTIVIFIILYILHNQFNFLALD